MKKLKNAIIFIDIENQTILGQERLLNILNLLKENFKIKYLMIFGNFLKENRHIDKIYTKSIFFKNFHFSYINFYHIIKQIKNINFINTYFVINKIGINAADENIKKSIELFILKRHHLKKNDVFILFSQDIDFKYDLDLLEYHKVKCLLIGGDKNKRMNNSWGNTNKFILDVYNLNKSIKNLEKILKNI